jgi:ketosteroid isomerase-like protein
LHQYIVGTSTRRGVERENSTPAPAAKEDSMRRLVLIVSVLTLAWAAGGRAMPAAAIDAAADVKAVDVNLYDAIATRDANRLADILDDGFMLINTFGDVYDKQKFIGACCTGAPTSENVSLGGFDTQIKVYGNAAVVFSRTEMRFKKDGEDQKLSWRSTRTYVHSGTKWKLVAEQRTTIG